MLSSHLHDKWRKVVALLREYENMEIVSFKNMYNEFKQFVWYELMT